MDPTVAYVSRRRRQCSTKRNVVMSRRTDHKHDTAPLSLYNRYTITLCLVSDHLSTPPDHLRGVGVGGGGWGAGEGSGTPRPHLIS